MDHCESIYNLIPKIVVAEKKPQRYVSKFHKKVKEEKKSKYSSHQTMGYAKVPQHLPSDYLRKQQISRSDKEQTNRSEKQQTNSSQPTCTVCLQQQRRPHVPKRNEKPMMGLKSAKNFVTSNIMANIKSVPKQPMHKFVDTPTGNTQLLQSSGLVPKFIKEKDFARIPAYLDKMKAEQQRKELEYNEYVRQEQQKGALKVVTEEERDHLLQGLKKNWEDLHHEYQGLSVITDSVPKKNRKEWLEAQMNRIEKDIQVVEKYKMIYIAQK